MYVCMYMYVCVGRKRLFLFFLSFFLFLRKFSFSFHIKCEIAWLLLSFTRNYAVEKNSKSICGDLFSHLKPLAHMVVYSGIPKSFVRWRRTTTCAKFKSDYGDTSKCATVWTIALIANILWLRLNNRGTQRQFSVSVRKTMWNLEFSEHLL